MFDPIIATEGNCVVVRRGGYVLVQQIDGVWWFIGPDGDKFVSLGVNHIEPQKYRKMPRHFFSELEFNGQSLLRWEAT